MCVCVCVRVCVCVCVCVCVGRCTGVILTPVKPSSFTPECIPTQDEFIFVFLDTIFQVREIPHHLKICARKLWWRLLCAVCRRQQLEQKIKEQNQNKVIWPIWIRKWLGSLGGSPATRIGEIERHRDTRTGFPCMVTS